MNYISLTNLIIMQKRISFLNSLPDTPQWVPNIPLVNILVLFFFLSGTPLYAQETQIIPRPNQMVPGKGIFRLSTRTPVITPEALFADAADYLRTELLRTSGLPLSAQDKPSGPAIFFSRATGNAFGPEAYRLQVSESGVTISAATAQGAFYGVVSLLQLTRQATVQNQSLSLPALTITDAPRYAWRGVLLDESRHFFGKVVVKKLLDWMSFYKLNRFHWHLTDSPGWRIEIKAYPRLTLVGGVGSHSNANEVAKYYTQEDIKEIVRYAAERHITVIPEIDMPGHATAANRAYPEFSGGGSVRYPDFTFNPGRDTTYTYLSRILRETDVLFPSQMIHLGGDEVHFGNENWNKDPAVQALMKQKNLKDLPAVELYFNSRMADTLFALNNKVLLWDEAVDSPLPADKTIIFWWRHNLPSQLKKSMEKGYQTVLTPRIPFYLDFVQDSTLLIGRRWGKENDFAPIQKLYNFSLQGLPVTKAQEPLILGVQAALWTEVISTESKLEFMLFPRITALAETAWTQEANKDLPGFMQRMKNHFKLYKKDGVYYYNPFEPKKTPEPVDRFELN